MKKGRSKPERLFRMHLSGGDPLSQPDGCQLSQRESLFDFASCSYMQVQPARKQSSYIAKWVKG